MAPFAHDIEIDLGKVGITRMKTSEVFTFKQDDNLGHRLRFHITVNGVPQDLTGWSGTVYFTKADANKCFEACTVEDYANGYIYCDLTAQTLSYAGNVDFELVLTGTSNEEVKAGTKHFTVIGYLKDDAAIESTSEFTALTDALSDITAIDTKVGVLANLTTTVKTSIVNAINSLKSALDTLSGNVTTLDGEHDTLATEVTNARSGQVSLLARLNAIVSSINLKRNDAQSDTWHELSGTFQNGFVNVGGSCHTAAVIKTIDNYIEFRGNVKSGATGTIAFTLSDGYKPAKEQIIPVASVGATAPANIDITSAGNCYINTGGANTNISLAGVRFPLF